MEKSIVIVMVIAVAMLDAFQYGFSWNINLNYQIHLESVTSEKLNDNLHENNYLLEMAFFIRQIQIFVHCKMHHVSVR